MTVEAKSEETQTAEVVVNDNEESTKASISKDNAVDGVNATVETGNAAAEESEEKKIEEPKKEEEEMNVEKGVPLKSSSFKEESNFLSDLKENEKKALADLKAKVEEAILKNKLFKTEEDKAEEKVEEKSSEEDEKSEKKEEVKSTQDEKIESFEEAKPTDKEVEEVKPAEEFHEAGEKPAQESEEENEKLNTYTNEEIIDKDVSIWGVPLFPTKGSESTDVVLLKFLRAREFRVDEAFQMLKKTLYWRKEFKVDNILNEEFSSELSSVAYMNGVDRDGHPVCYNIYGVFEKDALYQQTFGTAEMRCKFLRWRVQIMEKGIQKLDFRPGGISSLLQINDLKNTPGPAKKELRLAMKQAVALLQDNYPEFVARNIFINVPFWYYAFNAILSPFLTQRTRSKFVFARPSKVTETLLRYIPAEDIPIYYGGLKRADDTEFDVEDGAVSECLVKAGGTETIEILAPEVGSTFLWDLTVVGWDVNYKEEFVPTDEGSYTLIIQKEKKMGAQEEPIRNSFRNNENGKIVLTIENNTYKKKRVIYRYKKKESSS